MISETNPRGHTTSLEYDGATETYPVRKTLPQTGTVTHIYEYGWDYRYGKPAWERDENLNQTTYHYDVFGRVDQVDYPDGGQVVTQYEDDVFPRHVITAVKENASNWAVKYEYFDGLGRSIETITAGVDGEDVRPVVTQQFYDEMGRNDLSRGPFFGTGYGYEQTPPAQHPWVQTFFDYRGRPVEVRSPDGVHGTISSTFSYSGLSTVATDPDGRQKTEKKDYLGRLIQVKEHAETGTYTTNYTYNAAGDLLTVEDHHGNITTTNYDTLGRKRNMIDPDMGFWQYTYDANGNLRTQTDAKGHIITFTYDELNRVTKKSYSPFESPVNYTYDTATVNGKGRLYRVQKGTLNTFYVKYDAMGRVTRKKRTLDGTAYVTNYAYDLSGKLTRLTYPGGFYVKYLYYPGTGLLDTATGSDSVQYATFWDYEPSGKIGQADYANGTATRYSYDPESGRLSSIVTADPGGAPANDLQRKYYLYTRAGDIATIIDDLRDITYTYTYDYLHRLRTETNTGGQAPITYQYDAIGNITSRQVGPDTFTYTAYDPNHKHAVKTIKLNGQNYTFVYDENGNMTSGYDFTDPAHVASRTIAYNADNLPTEIQYTKGTTVTTTFAYDGDGMRTKKVTGGVTTLYIGAHQERELPAGVVTNYIFAGNQRIAKKVDSVRYYFHQDHLGSATQTSDSNGDVAETTEYLPFGAIREHSGTVVSNYKYTDQELDPETGLYNYDARLYDPVIGRFISADPYLSPNLVLNINTTKISKNSNFITYFKNHLQNPQRLNRYSYCLNNPFKYIDPDGLKSYFIGFSGVVAYGTKGQTGGVGIAYDSEDGGLGIYSYIGDSKGAGLVFGIEFGSYSGSMDGKTNVTTFGAEIYSVGVICDDNLEETGVFYGFSLGAPVEGTVSCPETDFSSFGEIIDGLFDNLSGNLQENSENDLENKNDNNDFD